MIAGMDWTLVAFMILPALMIGTAFGMLVALALAGTDVLQHDRTPLIFAAGGAALGAIIFLLTVNWWPPVIGPFILSPAGSMIGSLVSQLWPKNAS
jgi:hypothetical protein